MSRADIAALAHTLTVLGALTGFIRAADMTSAEGAIAAAATAACGLLSQGVIVWKYIHHQQQER